VTKGSELSPGTFVDRRYQVKCVLGRGGFGRTYLAADERRFGELCVLKEFVPKSQGDSVVAQKLYELFHREAQILHKLNHPQIPKFFAVFKENNRLFIAQEYINGKTYWRLLQERQKRGRAFSQLEVFQWLCHLLPVLSYLHRQNIVHRDISPDNIMLPRDGGLPVLIDFGVVKQSAPHWYEVSSINPDGSVEASVSVGKLGYAPYEQIRIGQCSPRSDLYALAVTAAVLLTAKSPNHLIDPKSLEWKWRSLIKIQPEFAKILETMMEEKPQDRYPSADAVLQDLAAIEDLMQATLPTATVTPIEAHLDEAAPVSPHAVTAMVPRGSRANALNLDSTLLEPPKPLVGKPATARSAVATKVGSTQTQHASLSRGSRSFPVASHSAPPFRTSTPSSKTHQNRQDEKRQTSALTLEPSTLYSVTSPQHSTSITRLTVLVGQSERAKLRKRAALLGLLGFLSIGGMAISMQSPHIASLCQTLNNCADGQWVAYEYQKATQQAETAKSLTNNASQIDDLENARTRIRQAIAKLRILPRSSNYAAPAHQVLPNYNELLDQIEARLEKEERAAKLLNRAEVEARMASEHTQAARTRQDYENARSLWRKALATIGAIPQTSFVADQAADRSQNYATQLQQVDQQIAALPQVASPSPNNTPSLRITRVLADSAERQSSPTVFSSQPIAAASPPSSSAARSGGSASQPAAPASKPSQSAAPATSPPPQVASRSNGGIPSISLAPSEPSPQATAPSLPSPQAATQASPPSNRLALNRSSSGVSPGNVPLSVTQTLNEVSVRLNGARVNPRGTFVATILVENDSDRPFGFVPLFAEVRDSAGQTVSSRVTFNGARDAMVAPGEQLQGEIYLLDRLWNEAGSQDLTLVIREGTSGSRSFHVPF
jgi:serine/threonine protein kinase/tetratricopeptide (TPR) repeat protein